MAKIERFFNNGNALEPYPWATGDVKVFYYADGKPACFCMAKDSTRIRESLPVEMFNHELKDLDKSDGEAIAYFLTEFGMFEKAEPRPWEQQDKLALKLCVYASFGLCETPPHFPFKSIRGPRKKDNAEAWLAKQLGSDTENRVFDQAMFNAHKEFDYASIFPSFDELGLDESTLVQYEAVVREIDFFLECRMVYAELLEYDDLEFLAKKCGIDALSYAKRACSLDIELNSYLRNYAPEISLVFDERMAVMSLHEQTPNSYDFDLSGCAFGGSRTFKPGSLSQALALQLLKFTTSGGCWKKCEKCKQVFVDRRTKDSTQKTRSSAKTCCDSCRNALSQQRYRDSLKEMKQKNKAQSKLLNDKK